MTRRTLRPNIAHPDDRRVSAGLGILVQGVSRSRIAGNTSDPAALQRRGGPVTGEPLTAAGLRAQVAS